MVESVNRLPGRRGKFERLVREIFDSVDVDIDGPRQTDIQVHDPRIYQRLVRDGSLGLGEAFMDGWWDAGSVDGFIHRIISRGIESHIRIRPRLIALNALSRMQNRQDKRRACRSVAQHYDLGNDLFQRMLDPLLNYSCGYWASASDLAEAQRAKLDLVCRKLDLRPGMEVLDIGCGWGGFARFAAENYGVHVAGITLSKEQCRYAAEHCVGLPVDIQLKDYRELNVNVDRIVSIGMFEHVGRRNYRTFMEVAARCLNKSGLFLLHNIGNRWSASGNDPWLHKYIFPNGEIPSATQVASAFERQFVMEDWHNFGPDYDQTLLAWKDNFDSAWGDLKDQYGERFYRMWTYYLLFCAGIFRARRLQLWQVVLSRGDLSRTYRSAR